MKIKPCQIAGLYYFKKSIDKILNFWYNIFIRFFKKERKQYYDKCRGTGKRAI